MLAALPALAFHAMLLMGRLGAAAMVLPGLGEQDVPAMLRLGLAFALVALFLPVLRDGLPAPPADAARLVQLVGLEVVIGLWLGGVARLLVLGFAMAGQMVALLIGLTSALVSDPQLGGQAAVTARFASLLAALAMLSTGLYALPLAALAHSYAVFPPGGPWPAGEAAEAMAIAAGQGFALALRLAAPFVFGAVVLNVSLGLLSRVAPQVQVYFVAIPGQALAGIALLALLVGPMLAAFTGAMRGLFADLPGAP